MYGARLMLWGFFKKIAVADTIAKYVDSVYDNLPAASPFDLCVAILFFSIQIYCDFSGYSDIAIGTAGLFGIRLMDNFNSPYYSFSIREFWSRWHISLSTWFRDYVYIPLGGNRCSRIRNYINLMITFVVSGLWHGANWTFVLWGGVHGLAQVGEKAAGYKGRPEGKVKKFLAWLIVFVFCNLAWVLFRADNMHDALYVIKGAIGGIADPGGYMHTGIGLQNNRILFSLLTIAIVFVYDYLSLKTDVIKRAEGANRIAVLGVEYVLLALILVAVIFGAGNNQFVYFQF